MEKSSKPSAADRLFVGVYPAGLVFADRSREVGGDYARLGFLSYRTLKIEVEKSCPKKFLPLMQQHADQMESKRGQEFRISTCNQTVLLGEPILKD